MSIINDALKKTQQGMTPKADETPQASAPLWAAPTPPDPEKQADKEVVDEKSSLQHKIKSLLTLCCAIAITGASFFYIYQQFQNDIPKVQRFAKKSFYQLIHKKEVPAFKTKAAEDLKPLAQLTISTKTATPPVTLNIHGIMSNTTGNVVLINDQVYQEGDEVDGAKILKINLDSITVVNNGVSQTISVKN